MSYKIHWFLVWLDFNIWKYFDFIEREKNHYILYHKKKTKVYCSIFVCRTSKYCFRIMIYKKGNDIIYNSFKSAKLCAKFVNSYFFNDFMKDINNTIC